MIGNHPFHPFTPLNLNMAPENATPLEKEIPILGNHQIFFQVNHFQFNPGGVHLFFFGVPGQVAYQKKDLYIYT